jgi:hypothetical protein
MIKSRKVRWQGNVTRRRGKQRGFCTESQKERGYQEDVDVSRRIILKWIFRETGCGGTDWIHLAQDTDQWRAPVNTFKEPRDSTKS